MEWKIMVAQMESDQIGNEVYVVPHSVNPELETRRESPPHDVIEKGKSEERIIKSEIVGVEEPSIPHLGWFIAGVALMLILINVLSIIFH